MAFRVPRALGQADRRLSLAGQIHTLESPGGPVVGGGAGEVTVLTPVLVFAHSPEAEEPISSKPWRYRSKS